eukprot:Gb_04459 [translate_table: standard]
MNPMNLANFIEMLIKVVDSTSVPDGWDKLIVSVISVETGKAIARTNKASVHDGSCQWSEDVSESVHFLQDDNSRELEEKLYKFVVSMGSARSGILGEATVNLADYLNSKVSVQIPLLLKKCYHGTILHVKIQCLTPRGGSRESEQWRETTMEQTLQNPVLAEADNGSEESNNVIAGTFVSSSNHQKSNALQQMQSAPKDRTTYFSLKEAKENKDVALKEEKNVSHKKMSKDGFAMPDEASGGLTRVTLHPRRVSLHWEDVVLFSHIKHRHSLTPTFVLSPFLPLPNCMHAVLGDSSPLRRQNLPYKTTIFFIS